MAPGIFCLTGTFFNVENVPYEALLFRVPAFTAIPYQGFPSPLPILPTLARLLPDTCQCARPYAGGEGTAETVSEHRPMCSALQAIERMRAYVCVSSPSMFCGGTAIGELREGRLSQGRSQPDKGKPLERVGRKATGLRPASAG